MNRFFFDSEYGHTPQHHVVHNGSFVTQAALMKSDRFCRARAIPSSSFATCPFSFRVLVHPSQLYAYLDVNRRLKSVHLSRSFCEAIKIGLRENAAQHGTQREGRICGDSPAIGRYSRSYCSTMLRPRHWQWITSHFPTRWTLCTNRAVLLGRREVVFDNWTKTYAPIWIDRVTKDVLAEVQSAPGIESQQIWWWKPSNNLSIY